MKEAEGLLKTPKRMDYIDIVRGFAMLCIIAGHMNNKLITRSVFTFHVPIFFIISGLLYKEGKGKTRANIIKLLKPYIFTVLCITILDVIKTVIQNWMQFKQLDIIAGLNTGLKDILAGLYGSGSKVNFLGLSLTAIGAIWFYLALIWALLFCKAILQVSRMTIQQDHIRPYVWYVLAILLWLIGFYTANMVWLPLSIQSGCSAVLFIIIGIRMKEYRNKQKDTIWIYLVAGLLWGISIYFSIIGNDHMSIVRSVFPNPIINILGAISATWILLGLGEKLEHLSMMKPLRYFGKYSMVVLSFHLIEMNIIPWSKFIHIDIGNHAWIDRIIVFAVKFFWCCIGIELARRIKPLKWIYSIKE